MTINVIYYCSLLELKKMRIKIIVEWFIVVRSGLYDEGKIRK